ncbi:MAG: response regulator [Acidimicrobiia bacterium]|nr:response regulator [Acidimicrobiia bacterium]MDH4309611.1 response regulator [Acidimicrobiia bacterium]MDH5292183.1 response regulator [Acidimicrobiia bacterium]
MKFVVCDDDPVIRYLLEVVLGKRGGHDVVAVDDATQVAVNVAQHNPDLVLLDFMMPGLTGLDVAAELAADPATAGTPVAFLTGRADIEDQDFTELNVVGVIEKPFDTSTLATRLLEMIA